LLELGLPNLREGNTLHITLQKDDFDLGLICSCLGNRTKRQSRCLTISNLLLGNSGRKLTMHEIEAAVTAVGIGILFSCPMGMECVAIGCLFDSFDSVVAQV
jgi:hypothetical protein